MHALSFPQVYDWVWLFRTRVLSKAALFNIRLSVVPDFGSPHPVAVGNWFYVRKKKKKCFSHSANEETEPSRDSASSTTPDAV